jgi:YgiT-type zinc finger domain-containing protein
MPEPFNYPCEYCSGTVRAKRLDREAFKHRDGFVILEDVLIGVCDICGSRYVSAATVRRVDDVATGKVQPQRTEHVPVAPAG